MQFPRLSFSFEARYGGSKTFRNYSLSNSDRNAGCRSCAGLELNAGKCVERNYGMFIRDYWASCDFFDY